MEEGVTRNGGSGGHISSPGKELGDDVKQLAAGVLFRCDHATCLQAYEGRGDALGLEAAEAGNLGPREPNVMSPEQFNYPPFGENGPPARCPQRFHSLFASGLALRGPCRLGFCEICTCRSHFRITSRFSTPRTNFIVKRFVHAFRNNKGGAPCRVSRLRVALVSPKTYNAKGPVMVSRFSSVQGADRRYYSLSPVGRRRAFCSKV
jgi:hypothetical protein